MKNVVFGNPLACQQVTLDCRGSKIVTALFCCSLSDVGPCRNPDITVEYQNIQARLLTTPVINPAGTFLSEVNNRETIAATETNNDTYCLQNQIEKFPLSLSV